MGELMREDSVFDHQFTVPFPPSRAGRISEALRAAGFEPAWLRGAGPRYAITADEPSPGWSGVWVSYPAASIESQREAMRDMVAALDAAGFETIEDGGVSCLAREA